MNVLIYKNQTEEYPIDSVEQVGYTITIHASDLPLSEDGFCIVTNRTKLEYYDFTTIYDSGDDYVRYSCDGSTKPIEPEPQPLPPEPMPIPEPSPMPSIEEQISEVYDAICDLDDRVYALENN